MNKEFHHIYICVCIYIYHSQKSIKCCAQKIFLAIMIVVRINYMVGI